MSTNIATTHDGARIAYQTEGTGPALVFIHGISERRKRWDPLVERLSGEFTCARLDLRGHGDSSRENVSPEGFASDIGAVLEKTGPAVLVGHSLGGLSATFAAAVFPQWVRGVVNFDQNLRLGELAEALQDLEPALRSAQFSTVLGALFAGLGADKLPAALQEEMQAERGIEMQATVLAVWEPLFRSTRAELQERITGNLRQVKAPYLAIHGSQTPLDYEEWLAAELPSAKLEIWPGLGHYLHLLEPDRAAERIRAFCAAL